LLEPGMQVTIAFCKVLDTETGKQNVDKIAKELVEYYTAHGKVADLLHHMIENEVKITGSSLRDAYVPFAHHALVSRATNLTRHAVATPTAAAAAAAAGVAAANSR